MKCPKCENEEIEKYRKHQLIGSGGMSVKGLGIESIDIYKCKNCGYEWKETK